MYQSSTRTNFLDILVDPTVIALLGSIALHAIIGASLPFFNHPDKEPKKAEPGTVKVLELTPSELQRIPQAPSIPAPVAPTTTPNSQVATPPSIPPISPNSRSIPFSPIRIPLEQVNPQPSKGNKDQTAIAQPQPTAPIFDPKNSFKPTTKPKQTPIQSDPPTKPLPIPTPVTKITKLSPIPDRSKVDTPDDDGGDLPQAATPPTTPNRQATEPAGKTLPVNGSPTAPSSNQPSNQPSGTPGTDKNSFPPFYGKYAAAASERIEQYLKAYPDIKLYKPESLLQSYPVGLPCSKVKQAPFIVLMAAFDKVPENAENNPLGDSTAPSIDKPYVASEQDTPENRKLSELAVNTALYAANKADQNRPPADKGKRVLYQYRVQFDPTTCK